MFRDRREAGRLLAQCLLHLRGQHPVVLALPRGGVPVGYEVAVALDAPLDVASVRKIGAPFQPELGIGAIVDGERPQRFLDHAMIESLGITEEAIESIIARELEVMRRRERLYRGDRSPPDLRDRTVIVVDDGIATGGSIRAVLQAVRQAKPRRTVLAVPVAPPEAIRNLTTEADEVVCLEQPSWFMAVGRFYEDFSAVQDEEVVRLLSEAVGDHGTGLDAQ